MIIKIKTQHRQLVVTKLLFTLIIKYKYVLSIYNEAWFNAHAPSIEKYLNNILNNWHMLNHIGFNGLLYYNIIYG